MKRTLSLLLAGMLVLSGTLTLASTAQAAYPPQGPAISVSGGNTTTSGVTVMLTRLKPGTPVALSWSPVTGSGSAGTTADGNGNVTITLPIDIAGTYTITARVIQADGSAGVLTANVVVTAAPPSAIPPVTCSAKAVSRSSKIKVNMGPNLPGNAYYVFRIDKRVRGEWIRVLKQFRTKGAGETRTVNVPKGTYRAKCYGQTFPTFTGTLAGDATSKNVKIKR